jgi:hypothetical protein
MRNVLWWLESGKIVTNIGAGPRPQVRNSIEQGKRRMLDR